METKFTPGPWKHCAVEGGWDGVSDEGGMVLCRLGFNNPANATLMAAAPELFDGCNALLGLIQLVCGRDDMPPSIKYALETSHRTLEAQEAVKKATEG